MFSRSRPRGVPFRGRYPRLSDVASLIERYPEDFFYAPFKGILANGHDPAGHPIAWSLVIAFAAYAILHGLIVSLLRAARPH